jgi:multimeric flavodoxin WrbA
MKTVLAIMGSPRRSGLTCLATRRFLDNLSQFGNVQSELLFLSDYEVEPCTGCKRCFLRGEEFCPHHDNRDWLIKKMLDADGVVFATPNYSFQVSGQMKSFLDRLGFVFHRPCFHGRVFTGIVAQGIYGGGNVVKYLDFVGAGLGFNVVKGSCVTALEPMSEKDRVKMERQIDGQSRRFHRRMQQPEFPSPSLCQLLGFRMGRTSIELTLSEDKRDYTYYRDHGWFSSDYFYPTRLGPLKRAAGAVFDWGAGRVYHRPHDANL